MTLSPSSAVAMIETALRLAIREVDPGWLSVLSDPAKERLREKQQEDGARRDGALPSEDLLDYTETTQLLDIVTKHWELFKPIFNDRKRTDVAFQLVRDYRNVAQHNRELLDWEGELLSGAAQQIRNQVALYRSTSGHRAEFYPVIEKVTDNFGRAGTPGEQYMPDPERLWLAVGDEIVIRARAARSREFENQWLVTFGQSYMASMTKLWDPSLKALEPMATGDDVVLRYTVTSDDVGDAKALTVVLFTASRHHRHKALDDYANFYFSVAPPADE